MIGKFLLRSAFYLDFAINGFAFFLHAQM